jgi:HSP20 family protein
MSHDSCRLCDDFGMRSRIQAVVLPSEPTEFRDEVRRIFQELHRSADEALTGECAPALDVFETDDSVEIVVDLPAVPAAAVRIVARGQTVLVAGYKTSRRARGESSFHLVERGYGRFARAIRLSAPCDTNRARATFINGELRISIPRLAERRSASVRISISGEPPTASGEPPPA